MAVGSTLLGKYQVESIIGEGGMGVVVKARHLGLNEEVAIKCLRGDVSLDTEAISRFVREAQAAVKLKSEHVARVSDVGTFEDGRPYMVMEYLDGQDLEVFATQNGKINPQLAIELILQAAEALAEAHSISIVHRDIKPTNLFITWRPDGSPLLKVLDFGISKSPLGADLSLTQTQSLLGTPAYMSPEQMRSARTVDPRTDIWSLGTVLYEVLEGQRPFAADSFSEMCVKVAMDPPTPMRNVPQNLAEVIYKCLEKAPDQRYANVAEFARAIAPFTRDPGQAMRSVDRMIRMLGRRAHNWDIDTNGEGIPRQVVEGGSRGSANDFAVERTPPPGQAWPGAGSRRADSPAVWTSGNPVVPQNRQSQPVMAANAYAAVSQAALPTQIVDALDAPRKSKLPLVIGLFVAVAAAVGIYLGTRPAATSNAGVAGTGSNSGTTTVDANTIAPTPDAPAAVTDIGSGSNKPEPTVVGAGSGSDNTTVVPPMNGSDTTPAMTGSNSKPTTNVKPNTTGRNPKPNNQIKPTPHPQVKPEIKPEIKPDVKPEVKPTKKCDPFTDPQGCKSAK